MKDLEEHRTQTDKMTSDELLSNTIGYLRFPLCVLIVFLHFNLTRGLGIQGIKHGIDNPDWYFFIIRFVSETLGALCVPLFFFISGFLFFYGKDFNGDVYKKKLVSRAKTLLIPYILWNFIALVWKMKRFFPVVSSYYQPAEIHFSIIRLINTLFCYNDNNGIIVSSSLSEMSSAIYPINGPLWYVRDLMVMVVLSPIIYIFIRRIRCWFVTFLSLVWFFSPILFPLGEYWELFMIALFFFSWGAFYSIHKENIVVLFRKYKFLLPVYVVFAIVNTLTGEMACNVFVDNTGIIIGVITSFVIVSYWIEYGGGKVNLLLANSSFFIFALHQIFLGDIARFTFIMFNIPENNPYIMLLFYFVVPIFTIFVCLILYKCLKLFTPLLCSILTGGR